MDKKFFENYIKSFLNQNSMVNLISKNDEKYLWEKHIFDSLAIEKFFEKYGSGKKLLDIGTGGGFPSVPIALAYPDVEVFALDSIRKKINAIENIKKELNIQNLHTICDRAENLRTSPLLLGEGRVLARSISTKNSGDGFDIITSRAVASLDKIVNYAMPLLKKDGYFVAFKSIKVQEEIAQAENVLKKHRAEVVDVIEYDLPLAENHTRNLVVISRSR